LPQESIQTFDAKSLLKWFSKHARALPWREHYRPYDVVLSEFMLQQTQVVTALPYYDRWIKRWPNWSSLAQATESEVLKMWEGLGYYQRARRLHSLAQYLVTEKIEELPKDRDELMNYPGLGPYTSAAVASIAFNQVALPIDGNVRRVLSRYYRHADQSPGKEQDAFFERELLPVMKKVKWRRDLAQALMELGASHCSPRQPDCTSCPIQTNCAMNGPEEAMNFPVKKPRQKAEPLFISYVWVERDGRFLLKQRPPKGRFPHQWEPPSVESKTENEGENELMSLISNLKCRAMPSYRRDFTRFKVTWCPYITTSKKNKKFGEYQFFSRDEILGMNLVPVILKDFENNICEKSS
jgi:A/G-specific adenine glycosylase